MKRRKEMRGETLTRSELAKMLYNDIGAYGDSYRFVSEFFDTLSDVVVSDKPVVIHGFGRFRCINKKSRQGRNPRTGEPVMITPRRVVSFIASHKFKDMLKDDSADT